MFRAALLSLGAAEDRVPRKESYVRDWARASLGVLSLSAGRGPLVVRASAGADAFELAAVTLRRL